MGIKFERRKHKRFKYEAIISHDIMSLEIIYSGRVHNFSNGGLYFESDQTLHQGEEIYIWTGNNPNLADSDTQILVAVEIMWHKDAPGSAFKYGYGAKLTNANDAFGKIIDKTKLEKRGQPNSQLESEKDARDCPRKPYKRKFAFTYQNRNYVGKVTNISRGGAFIETSQELALGKIIILSIPGRKRRKRLKLKGWVVRLNQKGVGVKFERRSGRERRCDLDRRIGIERRSRSKQNAKRQLDR